MKTRKTINSKWSAYDKMIAKVHLAEWGVIYLDEYGCPLELEDAYEVVG